MAASLVQPNCICTCNCAGHVHHHDAVNHHQVFGGIPFIGAPTSPTSPTSPFHGHGLDIHGHGNNQQHTFSTAPSISPVVVNHGGNGIQGEIFEPRVYPFKGNHIKHTHASYRKDTLTELVHVQSPAASPMATHAQSNGAAHHTKVVIPGIHTPGITPTHSLSSTATLSPTSGGMGGKGVNSWALCLPVPIPLGLPNATLESMTYTIRYASLNTGSATVQTDIVLARGVEKLHEGIIVDYSKVPLYHDHNHAAHGGGGYGPPMVNEAMGMNVASVPAFKNAGPGWSHYLDHQKVSPNIRIGEDTSYIAHASHTTIHGHSAHDSGCHLYLFFHVYEYPTSDAQRSLSVDISATWNDGEELKKAKEAREREVKEMRMERERMVLMKREVEVAIGKLEESMKKAGEESERRIKGEREMEKELMEREQEFLEVERKAREEYNSRAGEESKRLRELEEKERLVKAEFEKRGKEETERRLKFEETERKAQEEHALRMKEEEERLKEIALVEERAKADYEKRIAEEEGRMKELEEAQRKFKEETERKAKEDAERHAREEADWKAHEEAERQREERWAKEEADRRAKEEAEHRAKEEAELKAKEAAAHKIPSVAEAPPVADDKLQEHIANIAAKLGQKCKNGYAWEKKAHGYKCSGGGHFISFKDLGMA